MLLELKYFYTFKRYIILTKKYSKRSFVNIFELN